jgi:hypothetical protein
MSSTQLKEIEKELGEIRSENLELKEIENELKEVRSENLELKKLLNLVKEQQDKNEICKYYYCLHPKFIHGISKESTACSKSGCYCTKFE